MALTREQMAARRERKVRPVMQQYAPVWLTNDDYRPREDSMVFDLIYDNPTYGWVQHRFKYDAFADVLYHMGIKRLSETEVLPIQEQEPFIPGEVATRVPIEPAFRLTPSIPNTPRGV